MSQLPKSRIRIAGDLFRFSRLTDMLRPNETNQFEETVTLPPRFRAGDSLQIEVAIFNNGVLLTDLSAIARLQIVIKPLAPLPADAQDETLPTNPDEVRGPASNVAPIACKSAEASTFNTSLTQQQWESMAEDKTHAVIRFDSEESALSPGERWLSLIAEATDGQTRTLAAGLVRILGGGATYNALPQPLVKDLRDQAAQSAQAAAQSATLAHTHATTATLAAQQADSNAQAAQTSADSATSHASDAQTAAQQAADNANDANTSAQQAQVSASSAATAATAAANSQSAAQLAREQAEAAAEEARLSNNAQAAESAAQALAYRNEAQLAASDGVAANDAAQTAAGSAIEAAEAAAAFAEAASPNTRMVCGGVAFDGIRGYAATQKAAIALAGRAHTLCLLAQATGASGESTLLCQGANSAGGWEVFLQDASTLGIRLFRSDAGGNFCIASWSAAIVSARTHHIALSVDLSNPAAPQFTLAVDGQVRSTLTPATSGQYTDSTLPLYLAARDSASRYTRLNAANLQVYNKKLSAAEVAEVASTAGSIVPTRNRTTDTAIQAWTAFPAASIPVIDAAGGSVQGAQGTVSDGERSVLNPLVYTLDGTNAQHRITLIGLPVYSTGQAYELAFDYYMPATNSLVSHFLQYYSQNDFIFSADLDEGDLQLQTVGKWTRFRCVIRPRANGHGRRHRFMAATPGNLISFPGNGSDKIYIANLSMRQIGCVINAPLQDACGAQCLEHAQEKHLLLSDAGAVHLLSKRAFEFVWTCSTSGFLGDADRPVLPAGFVIEEILWEDAKPTRTSASLGFDAANPATHVSAWQPSQAAQRATLAVASPNVSDRRLYIAMSANPGTVTLRIKGRVR